MQDLMVGSIVHYVDESGKHRAAVVADILNKESRQVNLVIFRVTIYTPAYQLGVPYSDKQEAGTWHWLTDDHHAK